MVENDPVTAAVVARLVADQFPRWADLPVAPVTLDGWDNATFRLGDNLSVRLPRADAYVPQIEKEHRWLPFLAPHLPLPIPEPVAIGRPGVGFPRPWSIYQWIDGDPASLGRVADGTTLAVQLAAFLTALYEVDPSSGPQPGTHNFFRGGALRNYDAQSRRAIRVLAEEMNPQTATEVWEAALATKWDRSPVWVHGDVAASNLLVADGDLCAVIDFGCAAVGDPACDLVIAWTFFSGDNREAFRRGLPVDEATWARGRGWALWKALTTLVHAREGGPDADAAAVRFGWRCSASEVIDAVLTDHRRSS